MSSLEAMAPSGGGWAGSGRTGAFDKQPRGLIVARTALEILEHHLKALAALSIDEIMSDYTEGDIAFIVWSAGLPRARHGHVSRGRRNDRRADVRRPTRLTRGPVGQ